MKFDPPMAFFIAGGIMYLPPRDPGMPPQLERPRQTDCQAEPGYPGAGAVIFALRSPDYTYHEPMPLCGILQPHLITECGEWGYQCGKLTLSNLRGTYGIHGHCRCDISYWRVHTRRANYSAFNGYHWTPSAYSALHCTNCGHCWRSKAKYVDKIPDGELT